MSYVGRVPPPHPVHGATWLMHDGQREITLCLLCGRPLEELCEPRSRASAVPVEVQATRRLR